MLSVGWGVSLKEVQEKLLPGVQLCLRIMGKLRFARATRQGCAEGRSPFAEGLGVSPIFPSLPTRLGARGLKTCF